MKIIALAFAVGVFAGCARSHHRSVAEWLERRMYVSREVARLPKNKTGDNAKLEHACEIVLAEMAGATNEFARADAAWSLLLLGTAPAIHHAMRIMKDDSSPQVRSSVAGEL